MAEAATDPEGRATSRRLADRGGQRPDRLALAALAFGAAALLFAPCLRAPPILLLWNVSASAPLGLYRVYAGAKVQRGDMVVAWAPASARTLAARRHYLPANVPLVKRVAATAGDRVCAFGKSVRINGRRVSARWRADAAGRPMRWWTGCRRLGRGDYFLLMGRLDSFDGRYFGLTREGELVGRAVLLWAKPAKGSNDE